MKATIKYITYKNAEAHNFEYTTKEVEGATNMVRAVCSLLTNVKRGLPRTVESITGDDNNVTVVIKTGNTRVTLGNKKESTDGFDD